MTYISPESPAPPATPGTTLTVRSSAEAHHPAERATLALTVGLEGPDRAAVTEPVVVAAPDVRATVLPLFSPTGGPVTWWSAQAPRTWSWRPKSDAGTLMPVVHSSEVAFSVKFADFSVMAEWIGRVSVRHGVTIGRTTWALREATQQALVASTRDKAVRGAAEKARGYAASLGLEVVAVSEVADVGMLLGSMSGGGPAVASHHARGAAPASETLVVKPEDITVTAAVDARFLARPTGTG